MRPRVAGEADIEERCYLGQSTNNIAEYTGMVKALEHAKELGGRSLLVHSDSELMVKQMNGQYRVKNEGLLPLYRQAVKLREAFDKVTFKHVRREYNEQADALCNEAMDNPRDWPPRVPLLSPATSGEGPGVRTVAAKDKPKPPMNRPRSGKRSRCCVKVPSNGPRGTPPIPIPRRSGCNFCC